MLLTSQGQGKGLGNLAKVGPLLGIPTNRALWSWEGGGGGEGGEDRARDRGERTGKFCMAEQIAPSLAHGKALWASPERPAQPRTWELARGVDGRGRGGGQGDTPQRSSEQTEAKGPSQQATETSSSSTSLSPSRARDVGLTRHNP